MPDAAALQALLDAQMDAACIVGADQTLLACNRAFTRLLGARAAELVPGRTRAACHTLLGLECCEGGTRCPSLRARQTGRAQRYEEVAAKGVELTVVVAAAPLEAAFGEPLVLESYRDVTAEARVQARYRDMLQQTRDANVRLEQTVRERTEQLIWSEKQAALGRLLSGLAHELNNPVNFIYGNVKMLGEYSRALVTASAHVVDPELDFVRGDLPKLLKSIEEGALRASGLINDLKVFSWRGPVSSDPAAPLPAVNRAVTLARSAAPKDLKFVLELNETGLTPCAPQRLEQIALNLLNNAVDAAAPAGTVRVATRAENGRFVLEVDDSGPGISPAHRARLFEPFFTTKAPGKGTGMGLALSLMMAQDARGSLEALHAPLGGARFRLELPLVEASAPK